MVNYSLDPRDPKKLPDPVSGVESNDQVTNSEDQSMVDDVVAETDVSSYKEEPDENLSEKDKRDIADIN